MYGSIQAGLGWKWRNQQEFNIEREFLRTVSGLFLDNSLLLFRHSFVGDQIEVRH